mmetsp:Transcript_29056/g.69612  ORF Transcript_29056/g.69612 Transcript_29056/m.69612 type:complete len:130 (-) Transcript_29056:76-465(-)
MPGGRACRGSRKQPCQQGFDNVYPVAFASSAQHVVDKSLSPLGVWTAAGSDVEKPGKNVTLPQFACCQGEGVSCFNALLSQKLLQPSHFMCLTKVGNQLRAQADRHEPNKLLCSDVDLAIATNSENQGQ